MPGDFLTSVLVIAAAFFGAALNAAAGGGSFLTLPALIYAGIPPIAANATGTTALLPGYLASTWGFREDLGPPRAVGMTALLLACLVGGGIGAGLLIATSNHAFRALVPWLLLFATALFAFGPALLRRMGRQPEHHASRLQALTGLFVVSIYGGYFNGGLGVLLLALLTLIGEVHLNRMNALKNAVSAVLTLFAVGIYAAAGTVRWGWVAVMLPAVLLGGYAGARAARRIPPSVMRWGIVVIGLVMSALFFR
ncbi:MAG: sulfite exporter TauE/SafE family protein [Burkholderiaceae bacterium]|nr:sulfite exporter TauE/SafE family protein [Burkholderiaceae bacterium]